VRLRLRSGALIGLCWSPLVPALEGQQRKGDLTRVRELRNSGDHPPLGRQRGSQHHGQPCVSDDKGSDGSQLLAHLATKSAVTPGSVAVPLILTSPAVMDVPGFTQKFESWTVSLSVPWR
jgi:hypothetical protein